MLSIKELLAEAKSEVNCLDTQESVAKAKQEGVVLIDLREPEEHAKAALATAVHIPRGLLEFKIADVCESAEQEILLHCGGGGRASLAAQSLQKMGYKNVYIVNAAFDDFSSEYNK